MKMISMKLGEAARKTIVGSPSTADVPAYPYGLQIELSDPALKKLGITELPEAGEELTLSAKVSVTRSSVTDTEDGGKQQSVSLQITDMCLCESEEKEKDMAEELYEED